jgi:Exostosin family
VRVWTDAAVVPAGVPHVAPLCPVWGAPPEDPRDPNAGRFDRLAREGRGLVELVPLEEADVAVLAAAWELVRDDAAARERALQFIARAGAAGRKTIVFFNHDDDRPLELDGVTVFRTSLYRSRRRPYEFGLPAWSEDFLERYLDGTVPLREKSPRPVVGFCGAASEAAPRFAGPRRRVSVALGRQVRDPGVRAAALRHLRASPLVETNFVMRSSFWGGALSSDDSYRRMQEARHEYVQNMVDSDYVLCARGAGNFSYRLYETLNCGRIPVFVDTDCVLPLEDEIDWRGLCVWVEAGRVDTIADAVSSFHEGLSPQEFVERQHRARAVWEDFLSPLGFVRALDRLFGHAPV